MGLRTGFTEDGVKKDESETHVEGFQLSNPKIVVRRSFQWLLRPDLEKLRQTIRIVPADVGNLAKSNDDLGYNQVVIVVAISSLPSSTDKAIIRTRVILIN